MSELAAFVNSLGYKTRNKRKSTAYGVTGPRPFTKDSVRDIVGNPFYCGKMRYKTDVRDGKHEAIVTTDIWERCASIRRNHAKHARTWNKQFRAYVLKGVARCADCGERMRATTARSTAYYRCMSPERGIVCAAGGGTVQGAVVDTEMDAIVGGLTPPTTWQKRILTLFGDLDERAQAARAKEQAEQRLMRLARAYVDGLVDEGEFHSMKTELQAQINAFVEPAEKMPWRPAGSWSAQLNYGRR